MSSHISETYTGHPVPGRHPLYNAAGYSFCGDFPPRTVSLVSKQLSERQSNFLWEPQNQAARQMTARVFVLIEAPVKRKLHG